MVKECFSFGFYFFFDTWSNTVSPGNLGTCCVAQVGLILPGAGVSQPLKCWITGLSYHPPLGRYLGSRKRVGMQPPGMTSSSCHLACFGATEPSVCAVRAL